jgi:hypothetical protein
MRWKTCCGAIYLSGEIFQKRETVNKVDLLIIGAQKAGTTSLFRYMNQHPEIVFSRVKEVTYFVDDDMYAKGPEYFHSFFPRGDPDSKIVSGYVHMLACPKSRDRVRDYNPNMKFIVLLRHPVYRAWSAYMYARQMGWEKDEVRFSEAFLAQEQRLNSENSRTRLDTVYGYNGLYCKHLDSWTQKFPANQFLILRSDDLRSETEACLASVWAFLGVSGAAKIDTSIEYNRTGKARARWLNTLLYDQTSSLPRLVGRLLPNRLRIWIRSRVFPWLHRTNTVDTAPTPIPDDVDELLTNYYRHDLLELEQKYGFKL